MKETPEGLGENEAATGTEQPKKSLREPPSIPFVWELRPGVPKKDWKPGNTCYVPVPQLQPSQPPPPPPQTTKLIASFPFTWEEKPGTPCRNIQLRPPPPPVKLIASIPFEWEEMPGKPFPESLEILPRPSPLSPAMKIIASATSTLHSRVSSKKYLDDDEDDDSYTRAWISQLDLESFSSDTDFEDSSDSAPSLLGDDGLDPILGSPNINSLALQKNIAPETPGSPSTESDNGSTSSYMTGATSLADASSLVGASFLECLFPLLPPNNSGFLNKVGRPEKASLPLVPVVNRDVILTSTGNVAAAKRPHTLGELILMSRRMSCRRKAVQMRHRNLFLAFMKKNAFGRCLFRLHANQVERLRGKIKTQLRLKLL